MLYTPYQRYKRQAILKETGNIQDRVGKKTAVIVGLGGIGCMSAVLLARFGVGKLVVVDRDSVSVSNLHRQVLYSEKDIGKRKAKVAARELRRANSELKLESLDIDVCRSTVGQLGRFSPDIILDCVDNIETRICIDEYCTNGKIPWVFSSALGTKGMVHAVIPSVSSVREGWFRKVFYGKKAVINAKNTGILNSACNLVSCIQVTEAIKVLSGKRPASELIVIDIWKNEIRKLKA
ncbi:ThiF family adenylyltransferase [Candidatus Woesearchaeota archaeon]|nr:ThiF family adenylyltransferase [Candidatus Woesearchaeota archaeon]